MNGPECIVTKVNKIFLVRRLTFCHNIPTLTPDTNRAATVKPHSIFRFILGVIRHPSQAWKRIREVTRSVSAPSLSDTIQLEALADVEVIPVESDQLLQEKLVAMYMDNPSPFVYGPMSSEQLQEEKDRGIRFFLVRNNKGGICRCSNI